MSGINSLPGGGKDFSLNNFKRKFKYLSNKSKTVSPLSENQESIIEAVAKYQKFIRRGSFDKIQQHRAIRQIKHNENLGVVKLRKIKKIINKLGDANENIDKQPPITERVKDVARPRIRINRAGQEELEGPKLAGAHNNRGSGLSGVSTSQDYQSASTNRPLVSINQIKDREKSTGLANSSRTAVGRELSTPSTNSSRPSIPLAH